EQSKFVPQAPQELVDLAVAFAEPELERPPLAGVPVFDQPDLVALPRVAVEFLKRPPPRAARHVMPPVARKTGVVIPGRVFRAHGRSFSETARRGWWWGSYRGHANGLPAGWQPL